MVYVNKGGFVSVDKHLDKTSVFCSSCQREKELNYCKNCFGDLKGKVVQEIFDKPPIERLELEINGLTRTVENLIDVIRGFKVGRYKLIKKDDPNIKDDLPSPREVF